MVGAFEPGAGPPPPGGGLHGALRAEQRGRCHQALALLLLGLPAQHQHEVTRRLARAGRHWLPLHGQLDGARHLGPGANGRRGRGLGGHEPLHERTPCVPEPGRRHLLPLGLLGHSPGHRRAHQHHLQDPLQRRGGHDRRPAGGRANQRAANCAANRGRGREALGRGLRRNREVRRPPRAVPAGHHLPRPLRPGRRAARVARSQGRQRLDLRPNLRRRKAPPPQEERVRRPAAPHLHQRSRVRGLRRLRAGQQLLECGAGGDRLRPKARHRANQLQQGLQLRQRLLPELCVGRRRGAQEGGQGQVQRC